ncbi:MAG: class I SAM-dependent methyltransferase [Bacteroidia bacterium]
MNDLELYFKNNQGRVIHKWNNYFNIYDKHFSKYRNKEVVILEIGVGLGGSLQMWRSYFGDKAKIYGVDINPECKKYEEKNIEIFIGSQTDRKFLRELVKKIPPVDILIDDGGHAMKQQIVTFEELFSHVKNDGIYLCEDLHTSYALKWGGGYKRMGTFIEYSKNLIDQQYGFFSEQRSLKVTEATKSILSLNYYCGILVIEKGVIEKPFTERSGKAPEVVLPQKRKFFRKVKEEGLKVSLFVINTILRFFRLPSFIWK